MWGGAEVEVHESESSEHGASGADPDCLISAEQFLGEVAAMGPGGKTIADALDYVCSPTQAWPDADTVAS